MGFRRDHTFTAAKKSEHKSAREIEDLRMGLVGNSIHTPTLAMLVAPALKQMGILKVLPSIGDLSLESADLRAGAQDEELLIARMFVTFQSHRGGEIRLEGGPARMRGKPGFQAIDAGHWKWNHVISEPWKLHAEHISALECRGYLLALKWRSRNVTKHSKRFVHLLDSMAALGGFVKHRSPSSSLHYLMQRASALELAMDARPVLGYCRSHRNPADLPSRQFL